MFSEFFLKSGFNTACVAWGGLVIVLGYSMLLAWIKSQINDFYSDFYDLMQEAGNVADDYASGDGSSLADYRAHVWEQLLRFARIVSPLVIASPAAKWARSAWAFSWRAALMQSYLKAWDIFKEPIEGASQRLHEDTQRFCNALQGCLATLLDAIFTLGVFTPILVDLSHQVEPPCAIGGLRVVWLWALAFVAALVGLGGAAFVGQKLVQCEINNQKVEAGFRKDLVLLETTPAVIVGVVGIPCSDDGESNGQADDDVQQPSRSQQQQHDQQQQQQQHYAPCLYFGPTFRSLRKNYHALFRHFSLLNFWLSLFDQTMVILPYVVAAPLLFADDPAIRITLGTLVKMSNSFDKCFSSLSIIAENWGAVVDFRSVLYRLREFEAKLYFNAPTKKHSSCLLPAQENGCNNDGCGRSESLSHTRSSAPRGLRSGAATAVRNAVETSSTELVVVDERAVQMYTTYGDGHDDDDDPANRFHMRV